jgi:hypothetical protein
MFHDCHFRLSGIFLKEEGFWTSQDDTENKYSIFDVLRSLP